MQKGLERVWLTGESVNPWEYNVRLSTTKTLNRIVYKYSVRNNRNDYTVWEREPSRVLDI